MENDDKVGVMAVFFIMLVPLILSTYLPDSVDSEFSILPDIPEQPEDPRITELKAQVQKTINDIILDTEGHRVVGTDEDGLPIVDCKPFENEIYSISRDCIMLWK